MWFCPTYQRPERLRELADSWVKYEPETPLTIRLWEKDPRLADYQAQTWPENWTFYISDTKYFSAALNEFFARHPDESVYGFIADDIVLTGSGGLEYLAAMANPFFIAYPNDTLTRHFLPTHWCIGGELARTLGWIAPPFLRHLYTDNVLKMLGQSCGLLRYAPHVVFYHKHFISNRSKFDAAYSEMYSDKGEMNTIAGAADANALKNYIEGIGLQRDVQLIQKTLLYVENEIRKEAGLDEAAVYSNSQQSLVSSRNLSGGVGGRDGAGEGEKLDGESGRIQGAGTAGDAGGAAGGGGSCEEAGIGLPAGRGAFSVAPRVYKYPDANVVIGVPSGGEWAAQMASAAAMLVTDFMQHGLPGLRSRQLHIHSAESSMLVSNRHSAVKNMLQTNASHLLFIDSDMKFPPWALRQLMAHDLPFVAANCTKRVFPVMGTAHDFNGDIVDSAKCSGLETVRQVGLAFALIRRDVFEQLRPPLFAMEWIEELKMYCGEDVFFSQLVQQAGFDIVIDHDLSRQIGHIGKFIYGHGQVGHGSPPDWDASGRRIEQINELEKKAG